MDITDNKIKSNDRYSLELIFKKDLKIKIKTILNMSRDYEYRPLKERKRTTKARICKSYLYQDKKKLIKKKLYENNIALKLQCMQFCNMRLQRYNDESSREQKIDSVKKRQSRLDIPATKL